jgi:hypothetical protein
MGSRWFVEKNRIDRVKEMLDSRSVVWIEFPHKFYSTTKRRCPARGRSDPPFEHLAIQCAGLRVVDAFL